MINKASPFKSLFNGKFRKNRILIKLTASFILPTLCIILIISVFFSILYGNESMQDITTNSYLTLSNTGLSLKNNVESTARTAYQIYRNVIPLFYGNPTNEEKSRAVAYINNVIISSPQLYSVYIVVNDKVVLDFGGSPLYEEDSKEISSLILNNKNLHPKPRQIKNNNGTLDLITTIYSKYYGESTSDYVVLNFRPDSLFSQINQEFLQPGQSLVITDWNGNIISHNNKEMFSQNISGEAYFKEIKNSKSSYGSFNTYLKNKQSIINYLIPNGNTYIIFFISDYTSFFAKTISTRNTIIYFCLIALLLLALVYVFVSFRLYTPINNVFSNIRNLLGEEASNGSISSEEKHIAGLIGKFVERLNYLEKDSTQNFNSLKNTFLHRLLDPNSRLTSQEFLQGIDDYKLDKGQDHIYQMFVLRIDCYKQFLENNSKEAVNFQLSSIESIACDTLKPCFDCSTFISGLDQIIILASYPCRNGTIKSSDTIALLKGLQDTISSLFSLTLSIGISEALNGMTIKEFRAKYNQAYTLTNYRLIYGKGLIFENTSIQIRDEKIDVTNRIIVSIINSIKAGSLEQYNNDIDKLLAVIKNCSYEKITGIFFSLAEAITKIPEAFQSISTNTKNSDIEQMF